MGTLNTTATIKSDIVFQQIDTETNSVDNRQGSMGQSFSVSSGGVAALGTINTVYNVQDYTLTGMGDTLEIDFTAAAQPIVRSSFEIPFVRIMGLGIHNQQTGLGQSVFIRATGSDALVEIFNGQSGNLKINPKGSYLFSDSLSGAIVDSGNKNLQIVNNHAGNTIFTLIAVGVSG